MTTKVWTTSIKTSSSYASREEHVEILMQQTLVDLVAEAEALKELMCQTHHFMHSHIRLLHSTKTQHETI